MDHLAIIHDAWESLDSLMELVGPSPGTSGTAESRPFVRHLVAEGAQVVRTATLALESEETIAGEDPTYVQRTRMLGHLLLIAFGRLFATPSSAGVLEGTLLLVDDLHAAFAAVASGSIQSGDPAADVRFVAASLTTLKGMHKQNSSWSTAGTGSSAEEKHRLLQRSSELLRVASSQLLPSADPEAFDELLLLLWELGADALPLHSLGTSSQGDGDQHHLKKQAMVSSVLRLANGHFTRAKRGVLELITGRELDAKVMYDSDFRVLVEVLVREQELCHASQSEDTATSPPALGNASFDGYTPQLKDSLQSALVMLWASACPPESATAEEVAAWIDTLPLIGGPYGAMLVKEDIDGEVVHSDLGADDWKEMGVDDAKDADLLAAIVQRLA